uniref:Disco interacting A n=1 Tax=Sinocyclocheilus grahami TaxID=75366 RepID=A0A672RBK7_SINGR
SHLFPGGPECMIHHNPFVSLSLSLSVGDITQKGYEKKRGKLLAPYIPQIQGVDPSLQIEHRIQTSSQVAPPGSKQNKPRVANSRDERFRSDLHTEAVQAALAKYKERKMPMPSKRRSVLVQSSVEACTPPDTSSASEDEGSLRRQGRIASSSPYQAHPSVEHWFNRVIQGSSTSSSASSTSSHPGGRPHHATNATSASAATVLADLMAHTQLGQFSLQLTSLHVFRTDLPSGFIHSVFRFICLLKLRCSIMETADGVPVNSRVSSKIQQLLNTLKRPKRPPLREFFVDDFEELLDVQHPDPNQPKPEGGEMRPLSGEPLGVVTNWPPSLMASLQRWGTTQPKSPCLTALDNAGKPVYTLTYGKLWTRSQKLSYTLLNKLSTRNEPLLRPGDRVALVFPNNDPVMFMVAFYGCLLAELVPVPIEVPLTRKDAGSQQVGFLLGSCGVTLALTTDACQKGLPKAQTGEVVTFKGWPRLLWFVTDGKHVVKPPKDWHPPIRDTSNEIAYIEYKTSKEGSTMGITVSHSAMLAHCHALTQACGYTEGEIITNVLDFKRDAGLWHGVLTSVMNRMHVISIPYSLMKVNPLSWIQKVHTYKARVAVVKSRDMHWSLLAQRDQRDISLSSLRMLIVADGANPWSISSCDAFLNVFQARGLRPEVICPCASSSEAMTVAIRRPPEMGVPPPGKAVLSMSGLSYGVIRVDTEEKLSVLTVQDVGQVMPGALVCVIQVEGTPYLCRMDEVGEICMSSNSTGISYYGLPGMTKNVFETIPVTSSGAPISDRPFTRTSLLGFIGPVGSDNLVFVVGKMDGLMVVSGRRHNADDVVATALAVEPMKFVYRGRIAVFSVSVLHDERIVVVAEQRPDGSEEDSFQWMSRVLQAIDSIHQVGVYCLALVPANTLPKAPLGGIHITETKQRFLEGALHPCNVLMCPHTCVTNLPKPRQKQPGTGESCVCVCVGWLLFLLNLPRKHSIQSQIVYIYCHLMCLKKNFQGTVANTASCVQLHKRAERVAVALMERGRLNTGDHVALVYPPGIDLIATFYGCLYAGCVPVTVRPPHPQNLTTTLPTVKMIVEVTLISECRTCCLPWPSFTSQSTETLAHPCDQSLRNVNLSCVRTCMVVAEERPRNTLTQSFSKIFKDLGLSSRAVSTTFGCRVNVAICLQGTAGPDPTTVYLDMRALRHDRVRLVERGSPHSLPLMESGKILPGVKVIIANTETKGPLGDSHLGEIWVSSPHNATGYYTVYGEEALHADHFSTRLSFGDTQTVWARTGYLGFLRRTELTDASGERHDALYVVGSLDETLELRGMRYHPIDIETSVIRSHKSIAECAVFTWTNLLVVVVELEGSEQEALDLVALVTNVVLEEHYLIVGVVVVVDPGVIPINSRGEKQRMHLRDGFLADQLDPIYVAYNM